MDRCQKERKREREGGGRERESREREKRGERVVRDRVRDMEAESRGEQ